MIDNMTRPATKAMRTMGALALKTAAVAVGVHALSAAIAGVATTKSALKLASDAEQANIAFTTMLGSAEKATAFMEQLSDFANATPFDLPQLREASKKMLAFGFSAERVLPMLTAVGNASAGLSLGKEGIDRLTLALGQMRAKGKVSGDEMLQLVEAGIPAWEILAQKMNTSTATVMKMSEKGIIPADKAINALIDGMNKRFPDMMDKQSKSLGGMWSTMKDTFENDLLVKWGEGISAALKPRFDALISWINNNGATIKRWGETLAKAAKAGSDAILSNFERAFKYVRTNYLDNPAFKNLSTIKQKFEFIIDDLKRTFDSWYKSGGSEQIKSATSSLIGFISTALSGSSNHLASVGIDLGKSIASGMLTGLEQFAKENPKMAALMTYIATPGSPTVKLAAAIAVGSGGVESVSKISSDIKSDAEVFKTEGFGSGVKNFLKPFNRLLHPEVFLDENGKVLGGQPLIDYRKAHPGPPAPPPSHAGGLSRVPYNGYMARLHVDEEVLTKSDADKRRVGGGGSISGNGPLIHIERMEVRQDSDIDAVARSLARELHGLQGAIAQ
ncbi:tape measure protein [Paenibacillus planticolens]|uniref:Tape measure protein n=1 Tax=Paenibacillus planticolens TaxID=2654976 RepID=A0ABX1ZEG9_9BACL|nr:tape measure protein [Paenibacillus planticolens]NOU98486.1 tape measure protein [Paenibacillus planticolens]